MKLKAYAKLNLSLAITGTRPDGMHELDMLMQSISLADELTIRPAERTVLRCGGMAADESNTALRAARLVFEAAGRQGGAESTLKKHIPAQAGVGGGGRGAAAVEGCRVGPVPGADGLQGGLVGAGQGVGRDPRLRVRGGRAVGVDREVSGRPVA